MYEFESDQVTCYGDEGPCYVRRCIKCSRFVKLPETLKVLVEGPAQNCPVTCSQCGPSEAPFVCWAGDLS